MTYQERLDHWRRERRLIETHLGGHHVSDEHLISVFKDDISMADRFIRYYEAMIVRAAA